MLYNHVAKAISLIGTIQLTIHNSGWYNNAHSIAYYPSLGPMVFAGDGVTGIDDSTNTEYRAISLAGFPGSFFDNSVVYNPVNHNTYALYCLHEITGPVVSRSGCTDLAVGVISVGVGFHLFSIPLGHEDNTFGTYTNLAVDSDTGNVYFIAGSCNDKNCSSVHVSLIGIDGNPYSTTFNRKILDKGLGDWDPIWGSSQCCPFLAPKQIVFNPFNHLFYLHDGKVIYTMDKSHDFKIQNPIILIPLPRLDPNGEHFFDLLNRMTVGPDGSVYVSHETANAFPYPNPPPEPAPQGTINCTGSGGLVHKIDIWNNRVSFDFEVGKCPQGIAYDPVNRVIYVANKDYLSLGTPSTYADCNPGTVSAIDADSGYLYGTITVGYCPDGIAYDPANQDVYVVNTGVPSGQVHPATPSTISVISTYHPRPDISTSIKDEFTGQDLPYDPKVGAQTAVWDTQSQVLDSVKITRLPGLPPPTGVVTYYLVEDKECGFDPDHPVPPRYSEQVRVNPDGSVPAGLSYSNHGFNLYPIGYYVEYSGDLNYGRWVSGCEPLVWKVPPFPVSSLITSIKDSSGNDVTGKTVPVGTTVHDTANITGSYGIPTGSVTYTLYDNSQCAVNGDNPSRDIIDSTRVNITGGSVPPSDKITLNISGSVGYSVTYSGDNNYLNSISTCEPLTVFTNYIGSIGKGSGQFSDYDNITAHKGPHGTAIDSSGNIYASDTGGIRIEKFDSSGNFVKDWGAFGNGDGNFTRPWAVAIDPSDNVYVTDTCCNHRVEKFTSNGKFIAKWGGFANSSSPGKFDSPESIAVDSSGQFVYVGDGYSRIQKFQLATPCPRATTEVSPGVCFVLQWGKGRSENGTLSSNPQGIAMDSSGNVYVADTYNFLIQKFDSNGKFITTWGRSHLGGPCDLQTLKGCDMSAPGAQKIGDGEFGIGQR